MSEIDSANNERDKALSRVTEMTRQVAQIPKLAEERARTLTSSLQSKYDSLSKEYRSLESSS